MKPKISFRKTEFKEAKKIWNYVNVFYDRHKEGFKEKKYICVTAFIGEEPIAFAVKTFGENVPKHLFLSYTYIKKKYRGIGLAKTLAKRMLKYGNFRLEISPMNIISLSSHIHMGFEITDIELNHITTGFINISKKNSYYKAGKNFTIPIKECNFVNELFKKFSVDEIKFFNSKKSMGKISSHYKYYVGMYSLKYAQ